MATRAAELRPLGSMEEFLWLLDQNRPIHIALAGQIQGATTARQWREALDRVQARHPLLSVCIDTNGDDAHPHFFQGAAPIPFRLVQGNDVVQHWESEIELELSIPFDPRQAPLVRAVLLHEAKKAVVILAAHHSIADGLSIAFVIRDLLQALSGDPIGLLPLLPAHEELLGITESNAAQTEPSKEVDTAAPTRPAVYVRKEDLRPNVKGLRLTPELTGRLRERSRREGTTVHGALASALALAHWQTNPASVKEPVRVCSPIDTRKILGLGEDCTVLADAAVVIIEPQTTNGFWEIGRRYMTGLAEAQTLTGIRFLRNGLHQTVKSGIDVPTAAAICAQGVAHEILLTNLGHLAYGSDFGELKLEALWAAGTPRFVGSQSIGVATTNGSMCLTQISFAVPHFRLETVEQILMSECAE